MFSECLNCTRNHWAFNKCVEDEILAVTLKRHFFFAPLLMNFWLMAWSFLNCWEAEKGVYQITEICHKYTEMWNKCLRQQPNKTAKYMT